MTRQFEEWFRPIAEVVLLASERPVAVDELVALAGTESGLTGPELRAAVRRVMATLAEACDGRGIELREVASGFRYQVREDQARWVARFLGERPARYSRALLETLALIAYRQPITRGEIEEVRGVGVASSIMRTLHEREWIRVLSHRDVPGRPALYGTTRRFLDDFGLASVEELPPLEGFHDTGPADLFPAGDPGAGNGANTQGDGFTGVRDRGAEAGLPAPADGAGSREEARSGEEAQAGQG